VVWIPTFLARVHTTLVATFLKHGDTSDATSLGWALVEVLLAPLAGFVGFIVLFFLAYLAPPPSSHSDPVTASMSHNPFQSPTSSLDPSRRTSLEGSPHRLAQRKPSRSQERAPRLSISVGDRQRRMSRKRSRMLSTTFEDVWQDEQIGSDPDSKGSGSSSDDDSDDRPPSASHAPATPDRTRGSAPPTISRIVTREVTPVRRASSAVDPNTGRTLTWAERRRLLLEQQQAPSGMSRLGVPMMMPAVVESGASEAEMDDDATSVISDFDDPISMKM